jgi:nitrate/nitrite-specific signal transduction histidine kinase
METTSWLQQERKGIEESPSRLMTKLPTELLLDILARLPVNTMMQCKNVCRSWRDMVSTPYSGNKKSQYDCDIHSLSSSN